MDKQQVVLEYLQARSLSPSDEEWERMKVFIEEYEQARGETSAEILAEKVTEMLKGERSFLNHINSERARFPNKGSA